MNASQRNRNIGFFLVLFAVISIGLIILFGLSQRTSHESCRIRHSDYVFGIDVSHYQGRINWDKVKTSHHPIQYTFIRASMGTNGVDSEFERNWKEAKRAGYIKGAYHYYRPNEDAALQFENFKQRVKLKSGDFPPVLDIEATSRHGNDYLINELKKWLALSEAHYGVKPIIYTGKTFYEHYIKNNITGYPLWIAAYSGKTRLTGIDWTFHQFSENVRVTGIRHRVDGNDFNGTYDDLRRMCIGWVDDRVVDMQE